MRQTNGKHRIGIRAHSSNKNARRADQDAGKTDKSRAPETVRGRVKQQAHAQHSHEIISKAQKVIPVGVQHTLWFTIRSRWYHQCEGNKQYDIDGNEYIDFHSQRSDVHRLEPPEKSGRSRRLLDNLRALPRDCSTSIIISLQRKLHSFVPPSRKTHVRKRHRGSMGRLSALPALAQRKRKY
jgi:4-aminobutyrate aminotransferase-like enzyme